MPLPLPADSEKSCTWKFSVHSSSYLTKARRIGKTPGRIGIRLVEGQQHRKLKLMFIKTYCCFGQEVFKKLRVAKWFWIKPDFVYLDKNRCIFHHVNLVSTDECVLRIICMYQSVETKHIIQNTNYFLNFFMMRSFSLISVSRKVLSTAGWNWV